MNNEFCSRRKTRLRKIRFRKHYNMCQNNAYLQVAHSGVDVSIFYKISSKGAFTNNVINKGHGRSEE